MPHSNSSPHSSFITLRVTLDQGKAIPSPYTERWAELIHTTGQFDAPYLIFLAELLGLLDHDPAPRFTSIAYDSCAFGVDERWEICTRHIRLHREICETMSESWQRTETEINMVELTGLQDGLYLDWEGDWSSWRNGLTIGNLPAEQAPAIVELAQALFETVTTQRQAMSAYDSFRVRLKRSPHGSVDAADVDLYVQALGDEDDDVTLAALTRIQEAGQLDEPRLRAALLEQMGRCEHGTHARTLLVKSLGQPGAKHNLAPLTKLLRDGNSSVEAAAIEALTQIGDPRVVPALGKCLRKTIYDPRLAALVAVEKLATADQWPGLVPALITVLKDDNPHLQGLAVELLAALDDPRIVRPFIAYLDKTDQWNQLRVIAALGRWRAQAAMPKLRVLLQSDTPEVRAAAADGLRQIAAPRP